MFEMLTIIGLIAIVILSVYFEMVRRNNNIERWEVVRVRSSDVNRRRKQ
jgi:hypothetical protein